MWAIARIARSSTATSCFGSVLGEDSFPCSFPVVCMLIVPECEYKGRLRAGFSAAGVASCAGVVSFSCLPHHLYKPG